MRYQIDFCEAGRRYVPTVGLDGDVMLEQIARFGAPVNPPPLLVLLGGRRRSICRGLIESNCLSFSGLNWKRLRIHGIQAGSSAFKRTDQGYPAASHTLVRMDSSSCP